MTATRDELYSALTNVSLSDERAFRRRLRKARAPKALEAIGADIAAAQKRVAAIDAGVPDITYPEQLPVTSRREELAEAIANNQVVIIAGETGSGKTTQIPKICLELGRGRRGLIGHTQPRRLAARTVAERIADELGQSIGESVGYAIRFDDKVSSTTAVKLMTDGILLAEMQRDRFLNAYDTTRPTSAPSTLTSCWATSSGFFLNGQISRSSSLLPLLTHSASPRTSLTPMVNLPLSSRSPDAPTR